MELGNITGKIEGLFYNNATLIGVGAGALAYGLQPLIDNVQSLASGRGGMPDIGKTIQEFIDPNASAGQKNFMAIEWFIGGWLLKEVGFGGRIGGAIQNVAKGFIVGNAVQHVLHEAVFNHT